MKGGLFFVVCLCIIALITSGCDKIPFISSRTPKPAKDKVQGTALAKVNSTVITLEDFNTRVDNFNQMSEELKIDTFDKKKGFLQTLIQQELFFEHALSLGLDENKEINMAIGEFRKGLLIQKLISDELIAIGVEAQEIENFYNLAKNNYLVPAEIKAREIVVSSKETARQILIELLKATNFASLAQQYSKAPSAKTGGSLGWIKKGDRKLERFDETAFFLEKGEVSNIFKTKEGYFIVKLDDKRGGELRPISEVWDQVKGELLNFKQNQRIVEFERNLRATSDIEIHEELLR